MSTAVIFGGYGTFGSIVSGELARRGLTVTVAGRDLARANALAGRLGPPHRALYADAVDPGSCRAALEGQAVAACCAGPFGTIGDSVLRACLEEGAHYVDIADDRGYVRRIREWDARFQEAGLCAAYGCSSLPGLSGALALLAAEGAGTPPRHARVTLLIGNDNPKGEAAVRSLRDTLGRPVQAPQGVLHGFREPETVPLPPPWGPRRAYTFESPEYDLFPGLLGVASVSVKVSFELRLTNGIFASLAALEVRPPAGFLTRLGGLLRGLGSSGGAVMSELFYDTLAPRRAALVADDNGQRMAALPCAVVAHSLVTGGSKARGARAAYEIVPPGTLLGTIAGEGFRLEFPVPFNQPRTLSRGE